VKQPTKHQRNLQRFSAKKQRGFTGKLQSIGSPKTNDKQTITAADVALKM